jgi:hypothetical protein
MVTWDRGSAYAPLGATDELRQRNIELGGYRDERHDGGVVRSPLEAPDDVAVQAGAVGQCFLTQLQGRAALADFLTQGFEYVFARHPRDV